MDLLYVVLRTLLICTVGFAHCIPRPTYGIIDFNLTGRLNRTTIYHMLHCFNDFIPTSFTTLMMYSWTLLFSLPAYWFTRGCYMDFISILIPIILHLIWPSYSWYRLFNAWAGILWSIIIIFINTYSAVSPFNYLLELFVWLIGFLFWVLPGQPEPNQYGNPPFMPVNRPTYESMQPSISHRGKRNPQNGA